MSEGSVKAFVADFMKNARLDNDIVIDIVGSAVDGRWQKGSSDVDVVVYVRGRKKKNLESDIFQLYFKLDEKHGIKLQMAPFFHPPVIFVRNRLEKKLIAGIFKRDDPKRQIFKGLLKKVAPPTRILAPFVTAYGKYINLAFLVLLYFIAFAMRCR